KPLCAEGSGCQLMEDVRSNEVAGDHEEDVYADKAALQVGNMSMEEHHGQNSDGTEPVNVCPVSLAYSVGERFSVVQDGLRFRQLQEPEPYSSSRLSSI